MVVKRKMSYVKPGVYLLNAFSLNMLPMNECGESAVFVRSIVPVQAKELVQRKGFTSAIGHKATADILSMLLGVDVPVSRTQVKMNVGDEAIILTLNKRLEEGQVIRTIEELEKVGYSLYYAFVFIPSFPPSSPPSSI